MLILVVIALVGLYAMVSTFLEMAGAISFEQLTDRLIAIGRLGLIASLLLVLAMIVFEGGKAISSITDFFFRKDGNKWKTG
jgi:hypothetical protein